MINENILPSRIGNLPEVPWVMGDPRASYEWQVSVAGKGKRKDKRRREKPKKLENIVLRIRLEVKRRDVRGNIIKKLFGDQIEEDFNPIVVAETLLRALHHAKIRNVTKITADREVLFKAKNKGKDVRKIIQILKNEKFAGTLFAQVKIFVEHTTNLNADINIRRVHSRSKFPIVISVHGKIIKENLDRVVNYIKKHLPVEDLQY